MIGRMTAIGFGIALLLPALIFYGVRTFGPEPKYADDITGDLAPCCGRGPFVHRLAQDDGDQTIGTRAGSEDRKTSSQGDGSCHQLTMVLDPVDPKP